MAESKSGMTRQPSKVQQVVDPRADLTVQRALCKTELTHLAGGGTDETELQLKGNTVAAW
jgi:hypothetical protein